MLVRLLSFTMVGLVGGGAVGCVSEVPVPRCTGEGCGPVDDGGNTEPPRIFVDPPFGLGFDCVTLGCDAERRMVVENRGGGAIRLVLARLAVDSSADFTLRMGSDVPLPYDETSAVSITEATPLELFVRYVPRDGVADQGTVTLDWHDASVPFADAVLERVELPLSSRALGDVAASTTTTRLNFGFVPLGGYATRSVSIDNSGAGGILGVGPVSLEDDTPPVFLEPVAGAWSEQFANPGESAEVVVSFRPSSAGTFLGALQVATTDGGVPSLRIEVAGTSNAEPDAVVSRTSMDFSSIRVDSSRTLPLVVENRGGSPLTLTGSVVRGVSLRLDTTSTVEVAPLERATFQVTWSPTSGGPLSGRIVFATNDPTEPQLAVDVSGFANAPVLASTPASLNFGSVVQGWTTEAQTFELRNTGFGELTISSLTFEVGSSSQIRFAEVPTLPVKLSPDDPPVRVSVFMEASLLGTQTATILVGTDGIDGPLGQNGVGRLTASGLVVTCNVGCPMQNGTPSCGTGSCAIGSCNAAFHDADNSFASGCECGEDLVPGGATRRDLPDTCNGTNIGPLGDDCASVREVSTSGTLHDETDVDVYFFRATDESEFFGCDFLGDSFGVRIQLTSAPAGMQVCARQADDGVGCGGENQRRCVGAGGEIFFGGGNNVFTGSDTSDVTVWVEWAPGAAPQCGPYTLFVRGNDG
jgi:hypothetical protein